MNNIHEIRNLLEFFAKNYREHGNIFGAYLANICADIEESRPSSVSLFFSADTLLCSLKYILLKKLIQKNLKSPTKKDYEKI